MVYGNLTDSQHQLLNEISNAISSGKYYQIFEAIFTSKPAHINLRGMADHPTKSIACEEENLLVLEREKFIVLDEKRQGRYYCHLSII